jgi:branched-chain amino acid transport system substrate-binding protein
MRLRLAAILAASVALASPAAAELFFPSLSYRTGPFAAGGIPFADGYADYFTLLNERDGGIGGVRVRVTECETAYNTERGVECYEAIKGQSPLVIQPLSTGITYQLIPRVTQDGIPMHTMGYGRTASKNGTVFSHVFNYPANYWDGASIIVNYLLDQNGGNLNGKKITLLYHNSAYGKEPIRTLEELAKKHGYALTLLPVDSPGQEQKSQWLQIRRDRPDYVLMWGWGVMNPTAVQEAINIRYPMDQFIGVWWSGSENDVRAAGPAAAGYKSLNMHQTGMDFPLYDDLKKYVIDTGKAAGAGDQFGTVLYSRGIYAAMLAAEAAKKAQEIHGTAQITPAMMRDGMEALEITEARMAALGLPNFGPEFTVTCENHGGSGQGLIQQWDGQKWNILTGWIESDKEVIDMLVAEDSEAFARENNSAKRCN